MFQFQEAFVKMSKEKYSNIKLNKLQYSAYTSILQGKNIFITGSAGTGKSEIIKLFYNIYKHSKKIAICSTTGISAILIGGSTLHSYLGIGVGRGSVHHLYTKIKKKSFQP